MSPDRNGSTAKCAPAIQTFLMHLNLCGTEVKQPHYHDTLAKVGTDFWFNRTFDMLLFLFKRYSMIL